MDTYIIDIFIDYLKQNNAFIPFKKQLDDWRFKSNNDIEIYLINMLKITGTIKEAINYAFTWHTTKEGDLFWLNLHSKWKTKVEKGDIIIKNYNSIW